MESITIEISLPPKELSPNARCHWRVKSKSTKAYRQAACYAAKDAQNTHYCARVKQWPAATVLAKFYLPTKRRRDRDNLLASLKAAFDGLADAGLVQNDAAFSYMPVLTEVDKLRPRVVLTITRSVE